MKFLPLLSLSVPLIALAAQAETNDPVLRAETVVVTTPGPSKSAGELISHVSDLSRDDLVADLSGTLGDTLDRQPGVSTTFFGPGASRPVLRGLGAERVLVLTNGLGVIDVSAASPDHQAAADGIDAENIEILRGPAALAYGGQAIGGVVNVLDGLIVDALPADEGLSGDAFIAGQTVNDGLEASGRVRYVTGPLVFTLSASKRDFEDYDVPGFVESSALMASEEEEHDHDEDEDHDEDHEEARDTVENSFLKTDTLSGGVSWIGDAGFFGVAVRSTNSEYGLPGHDHEHEEEGHDEDEEEHEEEMPYIEMEQLRVDVKGGVILGDGALRKIEGSLSWSDYEHTEFEAPGEAGTRYESDGIEGRIELDHALGGFEGAAGLQFVDKSIGAFGEESFIAPTDTQSAGIFVYEARDWEDGFGIEGGLRYEQVDYDNELFGSSDFDLFSGAIGVHQHWASGWFAGLQGSYTDRAPNESELFADGPHFATSQYEVGDTNLDIETALNLEGTLRWQGDGAHFGASIYVTHFRNFIYLTPGETLVDGGLVSEVDGLDVWLFSQQDADFQGFEIYGGYDFNTPFLGAIWSVDGNLDYVEADLDNGEAVPYLPPMTLNGTLEADWGVAHAALTTTLAAEQDDPGEGILPTDGYAVFGLRGGLDVSEFLPAAEGIELFADIRNITDEEVRYSTSVLKDALPAPGRNIRFGVKASF